MILKAKTRKVSGIDDITNELIKYGGPEIQQEITKLFHKIISHEKTPIEWKTSVSILIYKKGCKKDPANYKGITLLSSVLKLLIKILSQKINNHINIKQQQNFQQNRSTVDAIFILRQLVEKSIEFDKPLYVCSVDLKQAFEFA